MLVLVVLVVIIIMKIINDSIIVDMYVNVYIYPSASYIYIYTISISIPISTYLPTKRSSTLILSTKKSKLHRSLFLIIPPRPARACAYVYVLYELMERFSSLSYPVRTSPRPSAPLPPKKKNVRFGGFAPPPLPCDGSSHIQSQLDKARQGKTRQATCLQKN